MLAALAHSKNEQGEQLSIEELADNMRLLAFAGHDTSAAAMAWTVIELARSAAKNPRMPLSPAELREHPLCEAIFREVIRLHPPVPLYSRRTVRPIEFAGHQIPQNEIVFIPVTDFSSDAEVFSHPERLDPERWLGQNPLKLRPRLQPGTIPKGQYLPLSHPAPGTVVLFQS